MIEYSCEYVQQFSISAQLGTHEIKTNYTSNELGGRCSCNTYKQEKKYIQRFT